MEVPVHLLRPQVPVSIQDKRLTSFPEEVTYPGKAAGNFFGIESIIPQDFDSY